MVGRVVVVQHLDALELGEPVGKLIGLSGRDVGHHDIGRAVGRELLVHDVERLLRLGIRRQVVRQVALDLDPVAGKGGEYEQNDREQKDEISLVDDDRRQLFHKAGAGLLGFVTHGGTHCLLSRGWVFASSCAQGRF